jgi:hypothetical protein
MNFGVDTSGKSFWQEAVWREERGQINHVVTGDYVVPPHPGPVRGSRYARGDPHGKNNVSRGVNSCMEAAAVAAALDFAAEDAVAHDALRSRCSTPFEFRTMSPTPPDSPVRQVPSLPAGYITEYDEFRTGGKAGTGNIKNESEEVAYCLSPPPKLIKARNRQSSRSPGRAMYELGSPKKDKGIKCALRGAWTSAKALAKRAQPRKRGPKRMTHREIREAAFCDFADIGFVSSSTKTSHGPKAGRRLAPGGAPRSAWSGRAANRTGVDDGCFGPALMLSDSRASKYA